MASRWKGSKRTEDSYSHWYVYLTQLGSLPENFLPCINGVSRTLARLLEHLQAEGHQCMLLGPDTGMSTYSGHPLVGTAGVPLVVYPGLKLNFLRPKFMRVIKDFVGPRHPV